MGNNLIVNIEKPIINTNFNEVRYNLTFNLEKYKGLIVTN